VRSDTSMQTGRRKRRRIPVLSATLGVPLI
jgi:hypothetical protein